MKGTSRDSYGRLVLGDIIIGADGKKIKTAADLYRALDKCKVGQNVDLELLRQDSKEHVQVCTVERDTCISSAKSALHLNCDDSPFPGGCSVC